MGAEEGATTLFQYGALGVWATASSYGCCYLLKQLLKAKAEHISDKDSWAKGQRDDYEKHQGVLRSLSEAHAEVADTAEASRKAAIGAVKRIDSLADAIPGVDKLTYQTGKNS